MPETVPQIEAEKKRLPGQPGFSDEALFLTDAPVPGPAKEAQRAPSAYAARTVTDWTALEALQESWQDLASDSAELNPFYEPWMLLPVLRSFART